VYSISRPPAQASLAFRATRSRCSATFRPRSAATNSRLVDPKSWSWRVAADLYVAACLVPKTGGVPENRNKVTIPTTGHVWQALSGGQVYGPLVNRAQAIACVARAFHWPLEFPEVMATGGFDVVLGNPPWERIKLQEQEFFAAREPEIADAPNAAARGKLIAALRAAEPRSRERALFEEFEMAKRVAEASSAFARIAGIEGGRFVLTGRGDVNTYALPKSGNSRTLTRVRARPETGNLQS
jgi:hypothetical protein